jgi:hypothetical protein
MNAADRASASVAWMVDWRRRGTAFLVFAFGVWVALITVWGLTTGWHFALNVSSAVWGSILVFGSGVGLIFAISAPQPLPPARWLASSALLSGTALIVGAWALGSCFDAQFLDFDASMDRSWLTALSVAYWLVAPWFLARLTDRLLRPDL